MAAPVAALKIGYGFRDDKGNTGRMSVIIGAATEATVYTNAVALKALLAAATNAAVWLTIDANAADKQAYGVNAEYESIEDKAVLTFKDSIGGLHRFQLPAPLAADFLADGETVSQGATAIAAIITAFGSYCYGFFTDVSPLLYVGGTRVRRKLHRKFNIWTLNPALSGPGV